MSLEVRQRKNKLQKILMIYLAIDLLYGLSYYQRIASWVCIVNSIEEQKYSYKHIRTIARMDNQTATFTHRSLLHKITQPQLLQNRKYSVQSRTSGAKINSLFNNYNINTCFSEDDADLALVLAILPAILFVHLSIYIIVLFSSSQSTALLVISIQIS